MAGVARAGVTHVLKKRGRRGEQRLVRPCPLARKLAGVIAVPGVGELGDFALDLGHQCADLLGQPAQETGLCLDHIGVHALPGAAACVVHAHFPFQGRVHQADAGHAFLVLTPLSARRPDGTKLGTVFCSVDGEDSPVIPT